MASKDGTKPRGVTAKPAPQLRPLETNYEKHQHSHDLEARSFFFLVYCSAAGEAGLRRRVLHLPGVQRQIGSLELRAAPGEQRYKEGNACRSHGSADHRVPAP